MKLVPNFLNPRTITLRKASSKQAPQPSHRRKTPFLLGSTAALASLFMGCNSQDIEPKVDKAPQVQVDNTKKEKPAVTEKKEEKKTQAAEKKQESPEVPTLTNNYFESGSFDLDISSLNENDHQHVTKVIDYALQIALQDEDLKERTKHAKVFFDVSPDFREKLINIAMQAEQAHVRAGILDVLSSPVMSNAMTINLNKKQGGEQGSPHFVFINRSAFAYKDFHTGVANIISIVDHELRHIARNEEGRSIAVIDEEISVFSESINSLKSISTKLAARKDETSQRIAAALKQKIIPMNQYMLDDWKAGKQLEINSN